MNDEELSRKEAYAPRYIQIVEGVAVQPCATMIPAYTTEPLELPKRTSLSRTSSMKRRSIGRNLSRKGSLNTSKKIISSEDHKRWQ